MAYEGKDTGYIVVIALLAAGLLWMTFGNKNGVAGTKYAGGTSSDDATEDGTLKCELRGNDGRMITITGKGPEFERLCRSQNQPVTWYGYQYYPIYTYQWYRPWGWRRWHGGGGGGGATGGTGM